MYRFAPAAQQALSAVRQQKRLPEEAMIAALLFGKNPVRIKYLSCCF